MKPVPVSVHVAVVRPGVPAAALVVLLGAAALAAAGGFVLAATRHPQVYLLRLDDRQVQRALPNPDFQEVYARFVSDVLLGAFTFNEYTASQSESFLVRYAEPRAALALARIRQPALDSGPHPRAGLVIQRLAVTVQNGLPVATVDAQWTWLTEQARSSQPLRLVLFLASLPAEMANHYRLILLSADVVPQ